MYGNHFIKYKFVSADEHWINHQLVCVVFVRMCQPKSHNTIRWGSISKAMTSLFWSLLPNMSTRYLTHLDWTL